MNQTPCPRLLVLPRWSKKNGDVIVLHLIWWKLLYLASILQVLNNAKKKFRRFRQQQKNNVSVLLARARAVLFNQCNIIYSIHFHACALSWKIVCSCRWSYDLNFELYVKLRLKFWASRHIYIYIYILMLLFTLFFFSSLLSPLHAVEAKDRMNNNNVSCK